MLPSLSLSVILSFACKVPSLPHTRTRLGLGRKAALTFPFFSSGVDSTASLSARSRQSGKTRSPNPQLQFFPLVCPCVLPPLREGAHFQPNIPPHRLGRARFLEHSSIGVFFTFFSGECVDSRAKRQATGQRTYSFGGRKCHSARVRLRANSRKDTQ